jgi:hypothetical protein
VTASIGERLLARAQVALLATNATPAGSNVFRAREIGITRGVSPGIVIAAKDEPADRFGDDADRNELEADFQIFAREVLGDASKSITAQSWETVADAVYVPLHAILTTDTQLLALCSRVRRIERTFEGEEADLTAGVLTVKYHFTFLTAATDVTVGPKP